MFIILAKLRASLHQLILKTLRAWQHFKLVRTCNECVEYNTRIRPQWILNSQLILGPQWNMFIIGSSCCVRRLYGTHVGGHFGAGEGPIKIWDGTRAAVTTGRQMSSTDLREEGDVLAYFRFRANLLPVWEFDAKVKSINRGGDEEETWSRQLISRHAWANKLAAVR